MSPNLITNISSKCFSFGIETLLTRICSIWEEKCFFFFLSVNCEISVLLLFLSSTKHGLDAPRLQCNDEERHGEGEQRKMITTIKL